MKSRLNYFDRLFVFNTKSSNHLNIFILEIAAL